jgi:hypothetical protein
MVRRIPVFVIPDLTASQDSFGYALCVLQFSDIVLNEKGLGNFTGNL